MDMNRNMILWNIDTLTDHVESWNNFSIWKSLRYHLELYTHSHLGEASINASFAGDEADFIFKVA